jgi:hypothetical protein
MRIWMIALMLTSLGLAGHASARSPGPGEIDVPPVLARDERLAVVIPMAVQDRPLGDLLPELAEELGVPLSASRETADDRVTLLLGPRPAWEVLALIARHFDFHWRVEKGGYRLGQDLASRNREALHRQSLFAAEARALRGKLAAAERMSRLSPGERQALQEQLHARWRAAASAAERAAIMERSLLLANLRPQSRPVLDVVSGLPTAALNAVSQGRALTLTTRDGGLSPDAGWRIRRASPQPMLRSGNAGLTEAFVHIAMEEGEMHPHRVPSRVLRVSAGAMSADGRSVVGGSGLVVENVGGGEPPVTETDDPDLLDQLEIMPQGGMDWTLGADFRGDGAPLPHGRPLSEILLLLHEETGLEFISDSFTRARLTPPHYDRFARATRVVEALDFLGGEPEYDWQKRGRLLELRSRTYSIDRLEEVPERLVRPLRDLPADDPIETLNRFAALAAGISDRQARALHQRWGWYFPSGEVPAMRAPGFLAAVPHFRWWASLRSVQKQLAFSRGLPAAGMAPRQLHAFREALVPRHPSSPWPLLGPASPPPVAPSGVTAHLSAEVADAFPPFQELRYTFRYEEPRRQGPVTQLTVAWQQRRPLPETAAGSVP